MDPVILCLREASIKLKCSLATTARALVLYHHFMSAVEEGQYDPYMIAAVALNLSGRTDKVLIDIDSLIYVFYSIINKTTEILCEEDASFKLLKKTVTFLDFLMRRMLEFYISHSIAYEYLTPFLQLLFERSPPISEFRSDLSSTCARLISDFYTSRKCLNYKAEHIAVACIDIALRAHGLLEFTFIIPPWYQGFCSDLSSEKVNKIKDDFLQLYDNEKLLPVKSHEVLKRKRTPM